MNSPVDEIKHILETCSLDLAQLHGDETLELFKALDGKAFKAFRGVPKHINGFTREKAPALLVDAAVKGAYGGTGVNGELVRCGGIGEALSIVAGRRVDPGKRRGRSEAGHALGRGCGLRCGSPAAVGRERCGQDESLRAGSEEWSPTIPDR